MKAVHDFIGAHSTAETGIYGNNNSELTDGKRPMKITFDIWDDNYTVDDIKGNLNYAKYDLKNEDASKETSAEPQPKVKRALPKKIRAPIFWM